MCAHFESSVVSERGVARGSEEGDSKKRLQEAVGCELRRRRSGSKSAQISFKGFKDMAEIGSSQSENTVFHIEKLDGINFPLWKEQIYNVLSQKKQVKTIKLKGVKPENMNQDEWVEMDELTRSTIMLSMTKTIYYNVNKCVTSYDLWSKLCTIYSQKSAASQIYWLK